MSTWAAHAIGLVIAVLTFDVREGKLLVLELLQHIFHIQWLLLLGRIHVIE